MGLQGLGKEEKQVMILRSIILFLVLLVTGPDKGVDDIARKMMNEVHPAGMSIGVLKDGKRSFYDYGEKAHGSGNCPDSATIYEIGSVSKTFTAALLAMAVLEHKIRLEDPVNKYLPDSIPLLQYGSHIMTVGQLVNHSSGLPRMPSNFYDPVMDLQDPYRNYTVDRLFSFLRHVQLSRAPGSKYEYSNLGMGLVGVIIQRLYGATYEQLVIRRICEPLGMRHTRVTMRKEDSVLLAKGYNANGEPNGYWNLPPAFAGAGAIRSTADDMLKYAAAQLGGAPGLLGKAFEMTHQITFTEEVTMGMAWHYIQPGKEKVLFHNGGTGGFRSYLAVHPKQRYAVIMLVNTAVAPENTGNELMRYLEVKKN